MHAHSRLCSLVAVTFSLAGWAMAAPAAPKPPGDANVLVFATASDDAAGCLPAPDRPVYYLAIGGGFKSIGGKRDDASAKVTGDQVWAILQRALASQGYRSVLPASKAAPPPEPRLLLVFHWGTAVPQFLEDTSFYETAADMSDGRRSALDIELGDIGGNDFKRLANWREIGDLIGAPAVAPVDPEYNSVVVPATKTDRYYVMVSAYDFALANSPAKTKKLLWRARMSVSATGTQLADNLGPLLAAGAPFFGRTTTLPQQIPWEKAQVKIGELQVVEPAEKK